MEFIWEPECYDGFRKILEQEIFVDKIYTKFFDVEENDIVVDIGASIGPFTYSILDNNPAHVFAFEPSFENFKTLVLNTRHGNVTHINKGLTDKVGEFSFETPFNTKIEDHMYSTTFVKFVNDYNIKQIDFLKTDCEGGEYDIFTLDNLKWIKDNVKKISGEWHLYNPTLKNKFMLFRDTYLKEFDNYQVYSVDGVNIKWDLWNDHFINYYTEIYIYIDNR